MQAYKIADYELLIPNAVLIALLITMRLSKKWAKPCKQYCGSMMELVLFAIGLTLWVQGSALIIIIPIVLFYFFFSGFERAKRSRQQCLGIATFASFALLLFLNASVVASVYLLAFIVSVDTAASESG